MGAHALLVLVLLRGTGTTSPPIALAPSHAIVVSIDRPADMAAEAPPAKPPPKPPKAAATPTTTTTTMPTASPQPPAPPQPPLPPAASPTPPSAPSANPAATTIPAASATPTPTTASGALRTPTVIQGHAAGSTCPKPPYPAASVRQGEEGDVQVEFIVDEQGRWMGSVVKFSNAPQRLEQASAQNGARCHFKAPLVNGQRVPSLQRFNFVWRLEDQAMD